MILGRYRCKLQIRLSVGIEIGLESRKLVTVETVSLRLPIVLSLRLGKGLNSSKERDRNMVMLRRIVLGFLHPVSNEKPLNIV